jgi:hypothetical protein
MVSVPARRSQVAFATGRGLSQRRPCTLVKVGRSALHYGSLKAEQDAAVLARMVELAAQYPRYSECLVNDLEPADQVGFTHGSSTCIMVTSHEPPGVIGTEIVNVDGKPGLPS